MFRTDSDRWGFELILFSLVFAIESTTGLEGLEELKLSIWVRRTEPVVKDFLIIEDIVFLCGIFILLIVWRLWLSLDNLEFELDKFVSGELEGIDDEDDEGEEGAVELVKFDFKFSFVPVTS